MLNPEILKKCWKNIIEEYFKKGLIAYERQLQCYLFHDLKQNLPSHHVWIEPMIFLTEKYKSSNRPVLDGKIPDMLITKDHMIEVVIELKCSPWSSVNYQKDIGKLQYFEDLATRSTKIPLQWPPVSSDWNQQLSSDKGEVFYEFESDVLTVFAVIAKQNTEALSKRINPNSRNFLHLKHCIENTHDE